jgi:mRNA-degrading endonuclease toxin of MazEF toxin-antitoxin module
VKLSFPKPGEVIRYAYLWHSEAVAGREEATKDRPCIVVAVSPASNRVWVAPITHAMPSAELPAILLASASKERLGLDDSESWAIMDELNEFTWVGPDIRAVPNRQPISCSYGHLPAKTYEAIRKCLQNIIAAKNLGNTR